MSDILDPQTTAEAETAAPVETAPEAETVALSLIHI